MDKIAVGICARLTKDGSKDIDLLVHSYYLGRLSPCVVIENGANQGLIGGFIPSLEQIFRLAAAKHPGYAIEERTVIEVERPTESEAPAEAPDNSGDGADRSLPIGD